MLERVESLEAIEYILRDYREGEIPRRDRVIIEDWVSQFNEDSQDLLLSGLTHALQRTYVSKATFKEFLTEVASEETLIGKADPREFWRRAGILDIQKRGTSQSEVIAMFKSVLNELYDLEPNDFAPSGDVYIYLDDCVASGNRVRSDVCNWLPTVEAASIHLEIIASTLYQGAYWINKSIEDTAAELHKSVKLRKWYWNESLLENRKKYRNDSDVLWPDRIPDEAQWYAVELIENEHLWLREGSYLGKAGVFQSIDERVELEQSFLARGCTIRKQNPNLPITHRPLGFSNLDSIGFGSLIVSYRNCPNNCPLVMWVQQDWYETLLPRKNNES